MTTTNPQGGLTDVQAQGIQQIHKANLAKGMTQEASMAAIKADPSFAQAKAAYNSPASGTNVQGKVDAQTPVGAQSMSASVTPMGQQTTEGAAPVVTKQPPTTDLNAPKTSVPTTQTTTPATTPIKAPIEQKEPIPTTPVQTTQVVAPDYNVGKGREQEIVDHLNTISKEPDVANLLASGNEASFKNKFGYDTADQTKKDIIDRYYQASQPQNSEAYFQHLANGGTIEKTKYLNSAEAAKAQHTFDILSPYKGASVDTLYSAMVGGILAPGSDGYKDLVKMNGGIETPEMIAAKAKATEKQKSDQINRDTSILSGNAKKETSKTQIVSDKVVGTKGMDYAMEFQKALVDNPELKTLSQQVVDTDKQIADLEAAKQKTMRSILADHPGLSTSLLYALTDSQNAPVNDQINLLQNSRNALNSSLEYKTKQAEKMFDYTVQQNQQEVAYNRQLEATRVAQEFQAKQAENAFAQQKEMARIQNEYKKADIETQVITDKATGKQTLINSKTGKVISSFDTGLEAKQTTPDWKQDTSGNWYNANATVSPGKQIQTNAPTAKPSGQASNVMVNGKNVIVDNVAADALNAVVNAIPDIKISGGMRSATTQKELYGKGRTEAQLIADGLTPAEAKQYAQPKAAQVTWTLNSNHMKGMAVDVVGDKAYLANIEDKMNENGWFRPEETVKMGDYGHFEYKGVPSSASNAIPGITGSSEIDATVPGYSTKPVGNTGATQASIDQAAITYITTNKAPVAGKAGSATNAFHNAVIARAGELPAGNIAANASELKSNTASLTQQTKYLDTTQRAFNTAQKSLGIVNDIMTKNGLNSSSIPLINQLENKVKAGGADVGAITSFKSTLQGLRTEYAQVLSRGGQVTEGVRKEADSLIPDNISPADLKMVEDALNREGQASVDEAKQQVKNIQDRINGTISPTKKNNNDPLGIL